MPIIRIESGGRLEITSGSRVESGVATVLLAPSDISDLKLWWDFSERDGNFVFNDVAGTVAITNGATLRRVNDRSGNGSTGLPLLSPLDTHAGTWDASVRNGQGAFNAAVAGAMPAVEGTPTCLDNGAALAGTTQIYTMGAVVEIPATRASFALEIACPTFAEGIEYGIGRGTADSGRPRFSRFFGPGSASVTLGDPSMTARTGEWFLWLVEVDGASSGITYNNKDSTPPSGGGASTTTQTGYRIGAGTDTLGNIRTGFNGLIGETFVFDKQLIQLERDGLFNYMTNKWVLTDSV